MWTTHGTYDWFPSHSLARSARAIQVYQAHICIGMLHHLKNSARDSEVQNLGILIPTQKGFVEESQKKTVQSVCQTRTIVKLASKYLCLSINCMIMFCLAVYCYCLGFSFCTNYLGLLNIIRFLHKNCWHQYFSIIMTILPSRGEYLDMAQSCI